MRVPGENHTFEIVLDLRSGRAFRQGIPEPPDARLETINILNSLRFRQFTGAGAVEAAVGVGGGNVDAGGGDEDGARGEVGERIELGAAPEGDGGAAEEEKRHVGAELGAEADQCFHRDTPARQDREAKQDSGRVG